MRRPTSPSLAEAIGDAAVREGRQALEAEGRPRAVAAQPLEPLSIARADGYARVDVEAACLRGPILQTAPRGPSDPR